MKKSIFTLALSLMFVFAASAGKGKKVSVKLKENSMINLELVQSNKVYADPEKLEVVMSTDITFYMVVKVVEAQKEQYTLNTKVDRIRLNQSMQGMDVSLDTKDGEPEDDQMQAMVYSQVKPMLDGSTKSIISNTGKVIEEEEGESNVTARTLYIELPEEKLSEGYTWTRADEGQPELVYTVTSVSKKEITVSVSSKEKAEVTEDTEADMADGAPDMDVKMNGTLVIDVKTGVVKNYQLKIEAETQQQGQTYYTVQNIKSQARY